MRLEHCRAGLSDPSLWGGIPGNEQFNGPLPLFPGPATSKGRFLSQLVAMNPNVDLPVPVRISQAAEDSRVHDSEFYGTGLLVNELNSKNPRLGVKDAYKHYSAEEIPDEGQLGAHFATIDYDTRCLPPG